MQLLSEGETTIMLPTQKGGSPASDSIEVREIPQELAIFPAGDVVLFPLMMAPLSVSDPKLVQMISESSSEHRTVGLFAQRNPEEAPDLDQLYTVGTAAHVERMLRLPDGSLQVLLHGLARIRLDELIQHEPYAKGRIEVLEENLEDSLEVQALHRNLLSLFQKVVSLSPN